MKKIFYLALFLLLAANAVQATIVNRCHAIDPSGLTSISCGASGAQGSWDTGTGPGANHTLILFWITYKGRNGLTDTLGLLPGVDNVQFNFHTGGPSNNFMGITCALTGAGGSDTITLGSIGNTFSDLDVYEEDFIVPSCAADNSGAAVGTGASLVTANPTASSYTTVNTTYSFCGEWGNPATAGTGYTLQFRNPPVGTDNAGGFTLTEDAIGVAPGTITGTFVSTSGTVWMIACASFVTTTATTPTPRPWIINMSKKENRQFRIPWDDRRRRLRIIKI
jgi:hypothetical protein